jgi:hypothetical protein
MIDQTILRKYARRAWPSIIAAWQASGKEQIRQTL